MRRKYNTRLRMRTRLMQHRRTPRPRIPTLPLVPITPLTPSPLPRPFPLHICVVVARRRVRRLRLVHILALEAPLSTRQTRLPRDVDVAADLARAAADACGDSVGAVGTALDAGGGGHAMGCWGGRSGDSEMITKGLMQGMAFG